MKASSLLLPLTPLYSAVVRLRAAAYRRGLLPVKRLPVPVVSVGNLGFGGTGKTPTVIALVRDLVRRGHRPAVLTRGYGRRNPAASLVLTGPDPEVAVSDSGDEPLEIARALPGVPVVVDRDRVRGGQRAVAGGADVLILDDGFQHLRLGRDLDLVLVDSGDPWAGGHLPPRGRLREPVTALARATAVLVTNLPAGCEEPPQSLRDRIVELAPGVPVLTARMTPRRLRTPAGVRQWRSLAGQRVLLFAALGRPEGLAATVEETGAEIVARRFFADHHRYRSDEVAVIHAEARRLDAVALTTSKDAVKLPADAPVWVIEAAMEPLAATWDEVWSLLPDLTPSDG